VLLLGESEKTRFSQAFANQNQAEFVKFVEFVPAFFVPIPSRGVALLTMTQIRQAPDFEPRILAFW
jgi:hypothetical protein